MGNVTAKTSGEIASFMTPAKTNIKSLKVHFSPKQLGTGDPSPENVREIEGWDGVEVNGSGRNLLQNANGSLSYLHLKKGTTITISQSMDANVGYFRGYDVNKVANTPLVWINQNNNGERLWSEYTLEDDIYYAVCYTGTGMKEAQITIDGSVDFEPYQGNNISYQWKRLPDEYQEVEYIESTGTQYIATNYIPTITENMKIGIDYMFTKTQSGDSFLFGSKSDSKALTITFQCENYNNRNWYCGNGIWQFRNVLSSVGNTLNERYSLLMNNSILTVNGSSISHTEKRTQGISSPIYIFAGNWGASKTSFINTGVRIYNLVFIANDIKEAEFIPCYRKSDNEIGMYDTISQTFYTNQGTGTFLKGNDVDKTFYGGYVDLISGELVEEYGKYVFTGDENIQWHGWGDDFYIHELVDGSSSATIPFKVTDYTFCNMAKSVKSRLINMPKNTVSISGGNVIPSHTYLICGSEGYGETLEECKSKLKELYENGTPLTIITPFKDAYKITHQLTPTQLSSFIGQNNFWSNADYVEIEYELKETEDIQKARKKIILNQPHIESINGDIASFTTNMKAPLKECKVYFNPIQEGSGDPSPDNVRNIVGWDGVSVGLPSEYQEVEYVSSTDKVGQYIDTGENVKETIRVKIKWKFNSVTNWQAVFGGKGTTFCVQRNVTSSNINAQSYGYSNLNIYTLSTNNTIVETELTANQCTNNGVTVELRKSSTYYDGTIWLFAKEAANSTNIDVKGGCDIYWCQLYDGENLLHNFIPCYRKSDGEIGMYDTVSKTFYTNAGTGTFLKGDDVNTIIGNVSWSDGVGTVYGGYVDLAKGEVVATHHSFTLDGINYFVSSGGQTYTGTDGTLLAAAYDCIGNNSFKDLPMGVIDSIPNSISNKYLVTGNHRIVGIQTANAGIPYYRLVVDASELDDISNSTAIINSLKIWLQNNPIQICYKLAEPIHYSLTPQQLLTFKGKNNIWSDTNGQIEVKFWTH